MTLSERLEHYEAHASTSTPRDVAVRRAYMAGALDALTSNAPREALLSEIVQFGLTVADNQGTEHEEGFCTLPRGRTDGWLQQRCGRGFGEFVKGG